MRLYTFLIGGWESGLELRFSSWGLTLEQAIKDGREQLQEQLNAKGEFRLDLDWSLQGSLKINLDQICAENLVKIDLERVPTESFDEVSQLKVA